MAIDPVCGMEVDENEALYLHATSCPTFTPRSVVHIQHASILLGHISLFCYLVHLVSISTSLSYNKLCSSNTGFLARPIRTSSR